MRIHIASLFFLFAIDGFHVAWANSLELFTRIERRDQTPPADALTVYDSEIDVRGIAWMPDEVAVRIPRDREDVNVVITRERMDRREGFRLSRVSCGKSLIMLPQVSAMDCTAGV